MISRTRFFTVLGLTAACSLLGRSQDPTFTVEVQNASIAVSVSDKAGRLVPGLKSGNFRLFENGEPREILGFYGAERPSSVAVLLDTSRSARMIWRELLLAFRRFLTALNPESELMMISFNDSAKIISKFTALDPANREKLFGVAFRQKLDGRTALFDSILLGLDEISRASNAKRAILLFGDGGDNASTADKEDVLRRLGPTGIAVHTVGISNPYNPDQNFGLLRKISRESGGYAGTARNPSDLASHFSRVARELSTSYVLAFAPKSIGTNPAEIRVEVYPPDRRRDLRLRYRKTLSRSRHVGRVRDSALSTGNTMGGLEQP